MKAIELMIGDWVLFDHNPVRVAILGAAQDSLGLTVGDNVFGQPYSMIEPIPLTEEIVGDRSCPQVSIYWDDRKTEETGENWYEVMIHTKSCAAELHIRYVHELQHALRLCGIEKNNHLKRNNMTQEEIKAKMQEGFDKIQPKVAEMTSIIMDAYQEGFNTCFELLTGQKFK